MGHFFTALVNPLFFASAALLYASLSLRKLPRLACLLALVLLLFFSSGPGSNLFLQPLESRYEGNSVDSAPVADAIVVLGGYLHQRPDTARSIELSGSSDRLWCAAELYRAQKASRILLSGGSGGSIPESTAARAILERWGIPPSAILTDTASRDTHQNAVFSQRILGNSRILLVTSAWHMRRAVPTFQRTGFTVIPFAADFLTGGANDEAILSLLPTAGSLANSSLAIKEWLGLVSYHLAGWV